MEKKRNLWVIPTDKPSRLCINGKNGQHIYITSDEEIKEGDWCITAKGNLLQMIEGDTVLGFALLGCKKIILTTDQDLIKDGVQAIDDEFIEWFVKNPSCEYVKTQYHYETICDEGDYTINPAYWTIIIPKEEPKKIFDLPVATNLGSALTETMKSFSQYEGGIKHGEINLPNFKEEVCTCTDECLGYLTKSCKRIEEPKQETLEEAKQVGQYQQELFNYLHDLGVIALQSEMQEIERIVSSMQQERMYSEEEVRKISLDFFYHWWSTSRTNTEENFDKWFTQFKK